MKRLSLSIGSGALVAVAGLVFPSTTNAATPGFYVQGRHLYDQCGEQVVLRGVNEMVVWSANQDGTPYFSEIAETGANVVRIVWTSEGTVAKLESAITNALSVGLIPMPELHDATGELSGVATCVDWWVRGDVVQMIQQHEQQMLLNIANEPGDDAVTQQQFINTYTSAITRMREAGINVPLIIDASSWGQDIDMLQAAGPSLVDADPDHNVMFSLHTWWNDPSGSRVSSELQESADQGLPLIVGEFAVSAFAGCGSSPFSYQTLLSEAQRLQIGWLAWSWGGVDNADCAPTFDMTTNGTYGSWENAWAEEVAVTDPNSIQNTSVRPYSLTHDGACSTTGGTGGGTGGVETGGSGGIGATGGVVTGGSGGTGATGGAIGGTGGVVTGGSGGISGTGGVLTGGSGGIGGTGGVLTGGTSGTGATGGVVGGTGGTIGGAGGTCSVGFVQCGQDCVDLATSVDHCGACDAACMLAGAVSACVSGSCVVQSCLDGNVDLDRNPVNGCEYPCRPTGVESCNGVDDDCNGSMDDGLACSLTGGGPGTDPVLPSGGTVGSATGGEGSGDAGDEGGCGCSVPGSDRPTTPWLAGLLALGLLRRRRS